MSRFARWADHEPPQHSMDFDGELDGAVSGMKTAVTTDRERELWCGVAEARTGDDRHSVKLALALDDGPQGVLVHVGGPLELPEHHTRTPSKPGWWMRDCSSRSKWTGPISSSSSRRRMDPSSSGMYRVPKSRQRVPRFPPSGVPSASPSWMTS